MSPADEITLRVIARIYNDFPTKFALPRQSGLVKGLKSLVIFEPEFRQQEAIRGLEQFSHIWLLWGFSMNEPRPWTPTVRPPRLGGNARMGVFATRSPYRPNPIGLSCVRLEVLEPTVENGTVLHVSGADLMNGTPIYDIKPYLPYTDSHPDACGGFAETHKDDKLVVDFPNELLQKIPAEKVDVLLQALAGDPRPAYQHDPERTYAFEYAGFHVCFKVKENVLTVCEASAMPKDKK